MFEFTREDFECAAKAAGFRDAKYVRDAQRAELMGPHDVAGYHIEGYGPDGKYVFRWRPRDDDGDALRLAAQLYLTVECFRNGCRIVLFPLSANRAEIREEHDDTDAKRNEAARLVIFRAAIAIGKAMP